MAVAVDVCRGRKAVQGHEHEPHGTVLADSHSRGAREVDSQGLPKAAATDLITVPGQAARCTRPRRQQNKVTPVQEQDSPVAQQGQTRDYRRACPDAQSPDAILPPSPEEF